MDDGKVEHCGKLAGPVTPRQDFAGKTISQTLPDAWRIYLRRYQTGRIPHVNNL
jgi:hypothetical protein